MNSSAQSTAQAEALPEARAEVLARTQKDLPDPGCIHKVFVPHSERLQQATGILGELVPFNLDYTCVRLLDGTYAFDIT